MSLTLVMAMGDVSPLRRETLLFVCVGLDSLGLHAKVSLQIGLESLAMETNLEKYSNGNGELSVQIVCWYLHG